MESKKNKKDLLGAILRDIEFTSSNYAQMHDRLRLRDIASRFFITYYSVLAILFTLIPLFFGEQIVRRPLFDFLTVSMSIVVLVASLLISFAKYPERVLQSVKSLDELKRLKKELSKYTNDHLWANSCQKYDYYVAQYHQIVDGMELRTDIDYYRTCKTLSSKKEYADRWNSLSWFNQRLAEIARIIDYGIFTVLFLSPFIVLWFCFLAPK